MNYGRPFAGRDPSGQDPVADSGNGARNPNGAQNYTGMYGRQSVPGGIMFGQQDVPVDNMYGQQSMPGTGNMYGQQPMPGTGNMYGQQPMPGAGNMYGQQPMAGAGNMYGQQPMAGAGNMYGQQPMAGTGNMYSQQAAPNGGNMYSQQAAPNGGNMYGQQAMQGGGVYSQQPYQQNYGYAGGGNAQNYGQQPQSYTGASTSSHAAWSNLAGNRQTPGYGQIPRQGPNGNQPASIPVSGGAQVRVPEPWAPSMTPAQREAYMTGKHPAAGQKPRKPFVFDRTKFIILCCCLALLFALAMLLKEPVLCYVFAGVALASVAFFWAKPLIEENTRLCMTVVCVALSIIAVVSGVTGGGTADRATGKTENRGVSVSVSSSGNGGANIGANGGASEWQSGDQQNVGYDDLALANVATATPAPESSGLQSEAVKCLESFFYYWSGNKLDEMLNLCSPAWQSSQDIPKNALFSIIANRTPLDSEMEKISGTDNDMSRTVTVVTNIDRNNGKDPIKYRMAVVMMYENGAWYVDPRSLTSYDAAETTEPVETTPGPTETPYISDDTVLYYNTDGGSKYHLDPSCQSIHSKYLPLKGMFYYKDLNDSKYVKLTPCNVCGAPLRP